MFYKNRLLSLTYLWRILGHFPTHYGSFTAYWLNMESLLCRNFVLLLFLTSYINAFENYVKYNDFLTQG